MQIDKYFCWEGNATRNLRYGDHIPEVVVNLIQTCWGQEETSRPTFDDVTRIISDQLCLVEHDLRRFHGRPTEEGSNAYEEQIVRPTEQPAVTSNPTHGSEIVQSSNTTSEMQACITGFRKVLTSLSTYLDPEYGLLPCLQFKGIITEHRIQFTWRFQIRYNEDLYWVEWRTSAQVH